MIWNNILSENLLISGVCACPGNAIGHMCIWDDSNKHFNEGDVLLLNNSKDELPLWAFQKSSAVISCSHTSYSHLTSFAMALNKPCIVGAVFENMPENSDLLFVDSKNNIVAYSGTKAITAFEMNDEESEWYETIANKVCEKFYSSYDKPLMHVLDIQDSEKYIDYISGIFLDTMIFQKGFHSISCIKNILCEIHNFHPNVGIYYRFSPNAIFYGEKKSQLEQEINFVCSLQTMGIPVHVFVANTSSYNDIVSFRQFISDVCHTDIPIKIGTMIENKQIVAQLVSIVADDLIDFAAVGINDLMSSYLGLDRDDPINQKRFRIDDPSVSNALITINDILTKEEIPNYIGFPKYFRFPFDFELLNRFGYKCFFGTNSLFSIAKKYGRL